MTNYSWKNPVSGDWATSADWTGGTPNNSAAAVTIAAAGSYTVTIASSESFSIASLKLGYSGATLGIAGALTVNNGFNLTAGTLSGAGSLTVTGGTIQETAGASFGVASLIVAGGTVNLGSGLTGVSALSVSSGTFALGANALSVASLSQTYSIISGTAAFTVTGAANFAGNYATQTGAATTLLQGATTDSGSGLSLDGGRVLENAGTFTWTGSSINLGYNPFAANAGGGTIKNDAGASFNIQTNSSITANTGATAFLNAGTLAQSIVTGTTYIQPNLTNTGAVSVQSGTLELDGSLSNSGTVAVSSGAQLNLAGGGSSSASAFTIASGATLQFNGGTFSFSGGTFAVAGATAVSAGYLNLSAAAITSLGQSLSITSGTLELGAQTAAAGGLAQTYSIIDGTGTLTVTGAANFTGNSATQTGAGTTLLQGATTDSGDDLSLDGGRVLENAGTFAWTGSNINLGYNPFGPNAGGGTIKNDAGASFNIETNSSITANTGATAFLNAGTLTQSVTTGTTYIHPNLTNTGAVSVQSGTLELDGSLTNSGAIAVSSGAQLNLAGGGSSGASAFTIASGGTVNFDSNTVFTFTGGTYNVAGTTSVAGNGLVADFTAATIASFGQLLSVTQGELEMGAQNGAAGALNQTSSIIDGTGTLTATGGATFTGGNWSLDSGAGTTLLQGVSTDSGRLALDGGRVLENAGTFTWSGTTLQLGNNPYGPNAGGGTIKNDAGANFNIQTDNTIQVVSGATAFLNAGTITRSGTFGTASIQAPLTNSGTISAKTGTLEFDGVFTNSGSVSVASGATLNIFDGGSSSGGSIKGLAGAAIQFGGGTFTFTGGAFNNAGATTFVSGYTDFTNASILSLGAQGVSVSGGTVELGAKTVGLATFTQSGGVIDGAGSLTLTGAASFSGNATETGGGVTDLQGATTVAGLSLDGGRLLQNDGALAFQGGAINLGDNPYGGTVGDGAIFNTATGVFDFQGDNLSITAGAGAALFDNAGLVKKSAGTSVSYIGAEFNNLGTVSVATGSLEFDGGGVFDGTISGAGTAAFGGGNIDTIDSDATLSVSGLLVDGATLQISSGITYGGRFGESSGDLNLAAGAGFTASVATLSGGSVDGAGAFTTSGATAVNGAFTFSSATWTNSGTLTVANGVNAVQFGVAGNTWSDTGKIVANADNLNFGGTWATAGTVTITNSSLDFQGDFQAGVLDQLGKGNTVNYALSAIVENAGHTFTISSSTNKLGTTNVTFTIRNGVVNDAKGLLGFNGGTLDGVTYQGTANIGSLTVVDGLTMSGSAGTGAGAMNETTNSGYLGFANTETLDNTTLTIGNTSYYYYYLDQLSAATAGATLTLDSKTTVTTAGYAWLTGPGAMINQGTIAAGTSGVTQWIDPQSFTNQGAITISNGDTVAIGLDPYNDEPTGFAFSNTKSGTITVNASSTLELGTGTFGNAGTVALAAGTLNLNGAILTGGTIAASGGGAVTGGGTLQGASLQGAVTINGSVNVAGGLTLTGTGGTGAGAVTETSNSAYLGFTTTETLDNTAVTIGNTNYYYYYTDEIGAATAGATLTLGSKLTLTSAGYVLLSGPGAMINQGKITASTSGATMWIDPQSFTNNGAIAVSSGDTLNMGYDPFNGSPSGFAFTNGAAGTVSVASGSSATLGDGGGTSSNAGGITATSASVTFDGTWSNSGTLTIKSSTVNMDGVFSGSAFLALFANKTDSVSLSGVYNNTGQTIAIGTGTTIGTLPLNFTIQGGTITDAGNGLTANGGTLDGVNYQGTLQLTANNVNLYIADGINATGAGGSGTGTIQLTGEAAYLYADDTETLNNLTLNVGSSSSYYYDFSLLYVNDTMGGGDTLTLGANAVIKQVGAYFALTGNNVAGDMVVNKGAINAGFKNGEFFIFDSQYVNVSNSDFINQGTITVSNSDALLVDAATFANTGTIAVTTGGVFDFQDSVTTAQMGTIAASAGTLEIDGTLDNIGATLAIGAGSQIQSLALYGTILGGTITDGGNGLVADGGLLDGVTYQGGPMQISANNARLTIADGINATGAGGSGAGTIQLTGQAAYLYADDTETLNNLTLNVGSSSGYYYDFSLLYVNDTMGGGDTLTLGAGAVINQVGAYFALTGNNVAGDMVVNKGAINAGFNGGEFFIFDSQYVNVSNSDFINQGTITVSNSDALLVDAATFANTGTIAVTTGGVFDFQDNVTTAQMGTIAASAGTLEIDGTLDNIGATLAIGAGSQIQSLALYGTILGGTITDGGNGLVADGGLLDGVTYQGGPMQISANNTRLTIADGINATGAGGSGAGTIQLTGQAAYLYADDTETLNNLTLNVGSSSGYYYDFSLLYVNDTMGGGDTLTLGAGAVINQVGAYFALTGNNVAGDMVVNKGAINAGFNGGEFFIFDSQYVNVSNSDFINQGTITVSNSDALLVDAATFANTGTIAVTTGGVFDFQDSVTTAQMGTIAASAGTLEIDGTLDNTGATLAIGVGSQIQSLALYGAIDGGTITDGGNGLVTYSGSILDDVTYEGALQLAANYANVSIVGGINATGAGGSGTGTINLTGYDAQLDANDTETLDNLTINVGSSTGYYSFLYANDTQRSGTTLTFGKNAIINHVGGSFQLNGTNAAGDSVVNQGAIDAGLSGGAFYIYSNDFNNQGAITVSNGDSLFMDAGTFSNTGTVTATSGGALYLQPSVFTNLSGKTLTGGQYEADAGSAIVLNANTRITTDNATIILGGVGAVVESQNTTNGKEITLDATLNTIGAQGSLSILGGRNFIAGGAFTFTDSGALIMGGGAFTAGALTIASGGSLAGFGTIRAPIANAGVIRATGGVLTLGGAVTGAGGLQIGAGASLVLGGAIPTGGTVTFSGVNATLGITAIGNFQDTLAGIRGGDTIDLINTTATSVVLNGSNQLVVTNNGASVITLQLTGSNADFDYAVASDGAGGTNVLVTSNIPPTLNAEPSQLAQAGQALSVTGLVVSDADATAYGESVTAVLSDASGLLSATSASGGTVMGAGTTTLTLSGTLAAVNAEIATLIYAAPAPGGAQNDTVNVSLTDSRGGLSASSFAVSINQPVMTTVPGAQAVVAGIATAITGISVADADGASAGETLTVVLSDAAGLLFATSASGGTVVGANTTTLTLSGSLAAVDTELASLTYTGQTGASAPASDLIDVATNDGRGSSDDHKISVSIDQPPMTTVPASENIITGITTAITGMSVADADAISRGQVITVKLTDTTGLLSATAASGATVSGAGTTALTLSGNLNAVNTELASVTYNAPTAGAPLTDTIAVATSDGAGGSNNQSIAVSLNQPPVATAPTSISVITAVNTKIAGVSIADGDANAAGETITVVLSDTNGTLSATASAGATVSGSGTKSLTLVGTLAGVDAELTTLSYKDTLKNDASSGTDTITIAASDSRGGTGGASIAVKINHVPPAITAPTSLTELSGQMVTLSGFNLTDSDPANQGGNFTMTLVDKYGVLSATAQSGATVAGAGSGSLTLAGSLTGIQAELATLTYTGGPTGSKPTLADTLTITATDSHNGASTATTAITIDHLPPMTTVPSTETVASGVVTAFTGISVADSDPTAGTSTFTTTLVDKIGLLSATAVAGATVSGAGTTSLTLTGSLSALNQELASVTYDGKLTGKQTSASDSVTVTTSDGHGDSDKHTIAVTITQTGMSPRMSPAPAALFAQYAASFGADVASPGAPLMPTPPLERPLGLAIARC